MIKQPTTNREQSPLSLLTAAHCTTIRRKAKRLDPQELSAILDDLVRELNSKQSRPATYLNSFNEIVHALNSSSPPSLTSIPSHYFFVLVRNTVRTILQQLCTKYQLNHQEILVLRNCILLFEDLVKKIHDVSKILHWITDAIFLEALASCLYNINKISKADENKRFIKQISRLLNIFADIQERLPAELHHNLFVKLLQPTVNCLTSLTYVQLFKDLKPNSNTLTAIQKLFLVKCPYFLTSYNGPHIEKTIEKVLEIMLPRYISILETHIKTIKQWHRPMMRAMHNLLTTIVFAEGYFTSHTTSQSFRSLIDYLLRLVNEPLLINQIRPTLTNPETILIDAALIVLCVLIYEPDALDYIKQCKPALLFRQLISTPCETIVLNAYIMLAYTMDENDIKGSQGDLSRLLYTTLNLLYKAVNFPNQTNPDDKINRENTDRNIMQLAETLRGLVYHEQVKIEIVKRNIIPFLIESCQKLNGLSKELLLECLWTLSFNEQANQQIRSNSQFVLSLQNIPKPAAIDPQQNTLRRSNSYINRSNSYINRRNSTVTTSSEVVNDGVHKMAEGLLWKLVKEPQKAAEKGRKSTDGFIATDEPKYKYDIMMSYSHNDKDICSKIQQFLVNEGFHIWCNHDTIQRQTLETVVEAIDKSAFVIICASDSYKRDNHCQAEAEYAFNSKRFILPLIVRKGYRIDGWLNSIIGTSTSVDFGGNSDFKIAASLLMREINQHYKRNSLYSKSRTTTPVINEQNGLPLMPVYNNRQPQQVSGRPVSRSTTPGRNNQLETPVPSNSGSNTPVVRSMMTVLPPHALANLGDQTGLPEEYINRNTNGSRYASIPINAWTKKDILDFLYDSKLILMMPLCESMTGQALTRLFRMCQAKPSRLYGQLKEELRARFKGLPLPMGVYTQFLIEMDALLGPAPGTIPAQPPPPQIVERVIYMPATAQPPSLQRSPALSTHSGVSGRSNPLTPMETMSGSSSTRVIERAIFRPASTASRPYNFIIESVQEPTALLQQVERYGPQLLLLDNKAREHRARNNIK